MSEQRERDENDVPALAGSILLTWNENFTCS